MHIRATSPLVNSFRVAKVRGMFDVPPAENSVFELDIDVPDLSGQPWSVGAIVGASGSGKTLLSREAFGTDYHEPVGWSAAALVDDFAKDRPVEDVVAALTAVGLSSAPVWLRPYKVLSVGQQHRADLARALLEGGERVVYDEFTSTVDRTVAAALSTAVAKYVRRAGRQFVAVSCHKDILSWLEADWVLDLDQRSFSKECQSRPPVGLCIREGSVAAWSLFRQHHYMTANIHRAARVFLAYAAQESWGERLVGFFSILPAQGMPGWWRGHRTVVLPDWQGMGIGNTMIEIVAEQLWAKERKRFRATTSAPGIVKHRRRHPEMWKLVSSPTLHDAYSQDRKTGRKSRGASAMDRLTTSWEYLPTGLRK